MNFQAEQDNGQDFGQGDPPAVQVTDPSSLLRGHGLLTAQQQQQHELHAPLPTAAGQRQAVVQQQLTGVFS